MMKTLDAMYAKDPANADLLNYSCTAKLVYAKSLGASDAAQITGSAGPGHPPRLGSRALKDRPHRWRNALGRLPGLCAGGAARTQ